MGVPPESPNKQNISKIKVAVWKGNKSSKKGNKSSK